MLSLLNDTSNARSESPPLFFRRYQTAPPDRLPSQFRPTAITSHRPLQPPIQNPPHQAPPSTLLRWIPLLLQRCERNKQGRFYLAQTKKKKRGTNKTSSACMKGLVSQWVNFLLWLKGGGDACTVFNIFY
jgi:hypothetical protein